MKISHFYCMLISILLCCILDTVAFYNKSSGLNRNGKFLFDTLFGLESAIEEAADEETSSSNVVKACNCGMYKLGLIFIRCCQKYQNK